MTILVIGSNGFMGKHLVRTLTEFGFSVYGVSSSDGTGIDSETGLLPVDFKIPKATEAVIYMAQSPHYRDPEKVSHVLAVNQLSAVRAAISARTAGVLRFIYVSTGTVYAPSFRPLGENAQIAATDLYSLSKIHGEQTLQMLGNDMDIHIVRPFGVYGPGQKGRLVPNLIDAIRVDRPITLQARRDNLNDKDGLRISLCHVEDASHVLMHLASQGGPEVLNLASDEAVSIRELSMLLGDLLGKLPILVPATSSRNFDLIADTELLRGTVPIVFKRLQLGLKSVIGIV